MKVTIACAYGHDFVCTSTLSAYRLFVEHVGGGLWLVVPQLPCVCCSFVLLALFVFISGVCVRVRALFLGNACRTNWAARSYGIDSG